MIFMKESRRTYKERKNAILGEIHNNGLMGPRPKVTSLYKVSKVILRNYILARKFMSII